jgi:hypothetical protein
MGGVTGVCVPELNRKVEIPVSAPNLKMRFLCSFHDRAQGVSRNRPVNLTESQISRAKGACVPEFTRTVAILVSAPSLKNAVSVFASCSYSGTHQKPPM